MDSLKPETRLNLHQAAQLMVTETRSAHDAEILLAHAIEHGDLQANVKRWATEQWEGTRLPGNIIRLETFIAAEDLEAWQKRQKLPAS